jgi:hypothetical protein
VSPVAVAEKPRRSKFTVILDARDAEDFDALVLTARRTLGRRVDKSELVRALIALLGRDVALRQEIYEVIRKREFQRDQGGGRGEPPDMPSHPRLAPDGPVSGRGR